MKKRFIISWFLGIFIITCVGWMSEDANKEINKFYFLLNNHEIVVGSNFNSEVFGEEKRIIIKEDKSTYVYNHLEINLKEETIVSIRFLDKEIKTRENIKISDSYQKMLDTYGNNFKKEENKFTYQKEDTKLSFIVQNNEIISIEYCILS